MSVFWQEEIKLTGRRRFREKKRWFRAPVQVEQVEQVEVLVTEYEGYAAGVDAAQVTIWRDARLEDNVFTKSEVAGT